jgi:hypothetical protein
MAVAIGELLNIPVIIRSLAKDFYTSARRANYGIPLDRDFLLALDGGLGTAAGHAADKFACDWWARPGIIVDSQLLSAVTISECLEFHRRQAGADYVAPALPSLQTPCHKPVYIWKPTAAVPISEDDSCCRCRLYCAIALGTVDELRDI